MSNLHIQKLVCNAPLTDAELCGPSKGDLCVYEVRCDALDTDIGMYLRGSRFARDLSASTSPLVADETYIAWLPITGESMAKLFACGAVAHVSEP